jgi:hypothetical protein
MKLDRGNPNLMKRAAMRVNPTTTLESFGNAVFQRKHRATVGFVPIPRGPNTVPPPQMSLWKREKYVPENLTPMRPGADDHLKYKSRGM